ncbi:topoisomerase DNA-binding C4 zinc finger domain-containing protein [Stutzerimonas nitrititolerans]|uniref:topoisomerase DNA-binding C4 zinc finger domain-containing protein n=1 Tax=Stutzerimonas nitrititolerans TaxID=2482751 RepID=UPI00289A42CF|nr:topoisomerase DNA-binding C4 zinc finger domain-containing protein [Stutzerimonas nitrititolerans]
MIEKNLKKFTAAVFILTLIFLKLIIGPVTCNSGWKSSSIGRQGACSHHGGVAGWKGSLPILLSGAAAFWFYVTFSQKGTSSNVGTRIHQAPAESNNSQPITPPIPRKPRTPRTHKDQKKCPKCNAPMSLRTAKKGKNPGSKFWGCKKYPRCKGTRPYVPE